MPAFATQYTDRSVGVLDLGSPSAIDAALDTSIDTVPVRAQSSGRFRYDLRRLPDGPLRPIGARWLRQSPVTTRDDSYFRAHVPASCVVPVC